MAAPSDSTTSNLQLLAALVKQRRLALGFSSKEKAADACGLSHVPYRNVEAGKAASGTTYAKIENRFELVAGSCQGVIDGADFIKLLDGTELIHGGQIIKPSFDEMADEVKQAITVAARLTAPHLTLGQTEEMTERLVEELQKRGILPSAS
jgi:hypothetical protein